nr:flippase-like domain-containing protein [Pseudomonadales bacterium]
MKPGFILTLKLFVVAVLFAVIFNATEWHDSFSRLDVNGEVTTRVEGQIIGHWNGPTVQFLSDESGQLLTIKQNSDGQSTTTLISPGFITYFKNLDIFLFALSSLMFVIFALVINTRWWWLLRANELGVSFWEAQRYSWIGFFFNNIIPGATGGDVIKAIYIARRCQEDPVRALVSVAIDRVIGLLS